MQRLILIIGLVTTISACGTVTDTRPSIPQPVSVPDNTQVTTTPQPFPKAFELEQMEPPLTKERWSNVTDRRAVSSTTQPRLAVECYNGSLVVRHDDMSPFERETSRSLFRINNRVTIGIGDRYNNVYMDVNSYDNLVERMYTSPPSTAVTITTDEEVTTQVGLNGFREAVRKVFGVCNY